MLSDYKTYFYSLSFTSVITCPVSNYTSPLIGSCESNSTVDWSTECTFGCAEGYLLEGDDTSSCGVNGQLNGSLPTCTSKLEYISLKVCVISMIKIQSHIRSLPVSTRVT